MDIIIVRKIAQKDVNLTEMSAPGDLVLRDIFLAETASFTEGITETDNINIYTSTDHTRNTPTKRSGCSDGNFNYIGGLNYFVVLFGVTLVCENILLITVIMRTNSLHTNTNILVASMAVTDVLMGIQCLLNGMAGLPAGGVNSWLAAASSDVNPHIYDLINLGINCSIVGVSLIHASLLAIDRYIYVSWPFRYNRCVTRTRVLVTAAGVWTLGLFYMLLPLALYQAPQYLETCILDDVPVGYGYKPIHLVYLVCLTAVIYCTAGMVRIARDHRVRRINAQGGGRFLKRRSQTGTEEKTFAVACTCNQTNPKAINDMDFKNVQVNSDTTGDNKIISRFNRMDALVRESTDSNLQPFAEDFGDCGTGTSFCAAKAPRIPSICSLKTEIADSVCPTAGVSPVANGAAGAEPASQTTKYCGSPVEIKTTDTAVTGTALEVEPVAGTYRDSPGSTDNDNGKPIFFSSDRNQKHEGSCRQVKKANLKIIKFVLVVFGTFFICTFPSIMVLTLVKVLNVSLFSSNHHVASDVLHFMITSNSGMNFLAINYMNKDFRLALVKTLPFCKACCPVKR